ncbi:MAG: rhomboid family intramembrane serine protease [Lachnospiraceae bacterium]|nr:rhomboid family intramembrane serine protease [Lachnospiraceae bacterium]
MNLVKRLNYNAPVTLTFALISLLALGLAAITNGASNRLLFMTYRDSWTDPLMYLRLFTHVLGHANWSHYIGNMLLILLLGPILEEKYGSMNLLEMIAITAFITGVVNNLLFPYSALLGASGIAFMFIILSSAVNFKNGTIPISFLLVFVLYVGGELVDAIRYNDNVSQLGHILGGTCGGLYGMIYSNMRINKK